MGIGPTQSAWKADILPLNYTRKFDRSIIISFFRAFVNTFLFLFYKIFNNIKDVERIKIIRSGKNIGTARNI